MHTIITNGLEIKQRIITEISKARRCIYLAMAYFTDRDIALSLIEAKNRDVSVEVIFSSNAQNEIVKLMLQGAGIKVHAFSTEDSRGIMHHKFCLIDDSISINGSYNFSYNASNNNVENIHVSDDNMIYSQLFAEFERLKYNIDHNISFNINTTSTDNTSQRKQPVNIVEAFTHQLNHLVYTSAQISTEEYKQLGYQKSKESEGLVQIFSAEYNSIKEKIRVYATDDGLGSQKAILIANISSVFENKKASLGIEKEAEISAATRANELEIRQTNERISELKQEKSQFESGNSETGERGLLQINRDIETNTLERKSIEQSFIVKKFWSVGTIFKLLLLGVLVYYLSMFFASAVYKIFFEGNIIRTSLEAGVNPGIPQLVDANAIIKIFKQQGTLFGTLAMLFFLIPILISNLELLGSKKKWVNRLSFGAGILIFDIIVSTVVALNTDGIRSLLKGETSQLKIWEVVKHGEFWLIFMFGMIPLIITHFLVVNIENAYKHSQRELVDSEKALRCKILDREMINLVTEKQSLVNKISQKEDEIKTRNEEVMSLQKNMNTLENNIHTKYLSLLTQISNIFDDFKAKITSGKVFTDEILNAVVTAFTSGFIKFLPEFYADSEVTKRVKEIELIVKATN